MLVIAGLVIVVALRHGDAERRNEQSLPLQYDQRMSQLCHLQGD